MRITALFLGLLLFAGCAQPEAEPAAEDAAAPDATTEMTEAPAEEAALDPAALAEMTIYEAAQAAGLTSLVAAVDAAGLAETLSSDGPFTVFAPTEDAFGLIPADQLTNLLENDTETLQNILLAHVVEGQVMAADVVGLTEAPTLNGTYPITASDEGVTVAGANVIETDLTVSNGVIHLIDRVIMP
ncbi:MAG: fasciclin domain-containing protein [Bacteroidota bacterium]